MNSHNASKAWVRIICWILAVLLGGSMAVSVIYALLARI
jgi:hypothetical protein